jgi:hypothetical protein
MAVSGGEVTPQFRHHRRRAVVVRGSTVAGMEPENGDVVRALLEATADAAERTAADLEDGASPDEAVRASGLLEVFDAGPGVVDVVVDVRLTGGEQRVVLAEACSDLAQFCREALHSRRTMDEIAATVVAHFREIAACVPGLVDELCAREERRELPVFRLGFDLGGNFDMDNVAAHRGELRGLLAPAVAIYGADAVSEAVERWRPDDDEWRTLGGLVRRGRSAEALKFVFLAALREAGLEVGGEGDRRR